jgi:hypothetical protein
MASQLNPDPDTGQNQKPKNRMVHIIEKKKAIHKTIWADPDQKRTRT